MEGWNIANQVNQKVSFRIQQFQKLVALSLAKRPSKYFRTRLWDTTRILLAQRRALCYFINSKARRERLKQRSLLYKGTGKILRRMPIYRSPQIYLLRMSCRYSGSTCASCHSASLLSPSISLKKRSISLKSKLLNLRRFSYMGLLRSQILESTQVSQGRTITRFTSNLLVLMSNSAVQSALVSGDTKRMSTRLLCWTQAEGRWVFCAWITPSLLSEQSMRLILWCRLVLRGSSRKEVGRCTHLLNQDSACRTIMASVRVHQLKLKLIPLSKEVAVVGMHILSTFIMMQQ